MHWELFACRNEPRVLSEPKFRLNFGCFYVLTKSKLLVGSAGIIAMDHWPSTSTTSWLFRWVWTRIQTCLSLFLLVSPQKLPFWLTQLHLIWDLLAVLPPSYPLFSLALLFHYSPSFSASLSSFFGKHSGLPLFLFIQYGEPYYFEGVLF